MQSNFLISQHFQLDSLADILQFPNFISSSILSMHCIENLIKNKYMQIELKLVKEAKVSLYKFEIVHIGDEQQRNIPTG